MHEIRITTQAGSLDAAEFPRLRIGKSFGAGRYGRVLECGCALLMVQGHEAG